MNRRISLFFVLALVLSGSCRQNQGELFDLLSSQRTGIDFVNQIDEDEIANVINYVNIYTGAGVGVLDINNDGLTDVFFAGNLTKGKLYLNKGDMKFEDITESAGLGHNVWQTGVSIVDINQDGWMDLYVSVAGKSIFGDSSNLLYVNNGNQTFSEQAVSYGIADLRNTIQSAFFDYDLDGDLDLFLIVNEAEITEGVNNIRPRKLKGESNSTDVLYRNNGDGTFTDVSEEAGILIEGYSLGLAISDINLDGYPDIYISNDFIGSDILYINQKDGTFLNEITDYFRHTSYAGMGNDIADLNNDGLVEVLELDMRPEDNYRQKMIISPGGYDYFQRMLANGYQAAYNRNTLQWNRGANLFSEIGFMAGVSSTDWSWSGMMADLDLDGFRDIVVTNGFLRDIGDLDYINDQKGFNSPMGEPEAKLVMKYEEISALPKVAVPNYFFKNENGLSFTKQTTWAIAPPSVSSGATMADLDNDGDLDIIISNINEPVHIYRNKAREQLQNHFIQIRLKGYPGNMDGIGAKISLFQRGEIKFHEQFLSRGYESSFDPLVHIGLGENPVIDSLWITWPNLKTQKIRSLKPDQLHLISYQVEDNPEIFSPTPSNESTRAVFGQSHLSDSLFVHREDQFFDFNYQATLPHLHSTGGPGIAVGDLNGDGLQDFVVGGAAGQSGGVFIQNTDMTFVKKGMPDLDRVYEDMGILLFDATGDGSVDMYVVSGGSSFSPDSPLYQDRLYVNDGAGNFSKASLPVMHDSGSVAVATDFDRDGDLDLFVGGRVSPRNYPLSPRSYLLRNDSRAGEVVFTDVTENHFGTRELGMVSGALWTDFNGDGWDDLIMVGEFMPVRFYENQKGRLQEISNRVVPVAGFGWWNSINAGDVDNDGDTDYILGNYGVNNKFQAGIESPVRVYAKDFDKNGQLDPILTYVSDGQEQIVHFRNELASQISAIKRRFTNYKVYASTNFDNSFSEEEIEDAYQLKADNFQTVWLENLGQGDFEVRALPQVTQVSPVYGTLVEDVDQDGNLDIITIGNFYGSEISNGRFDASIGALLRGDGKGTFEFVGNRRSNLSLTFESRSLVQLPLLNDQLLYLIGNNNGPVVSMVRDKVRYFLPQIHDKKVTVFFKNGRTRKHECYLGAGYLSQSAGGFELTPHMTKLKVEGLEGERIIHLK